MRNIKALKENNENALCSLRRLWPKTSSDRGTLQQHLPGIHEQPQGKRSVELSTSFTSECYIFHFVCLIQPWSSMTSGSFISFLFVPFVSSCFHFSLFMQKYCELKNSSSNQTIKDYRLTLELHTFLRKQVDCCSVHSFTEKTWPWFNRDLTETQSHIDSHFIVTRKLIFWFSLCLLLNHHVSSLYLSGYGYVLAVVIVLTQIW